MQTKSITKIFSIRYAKEGDKKTPKGTFEIENLYFRKDRIQKPITSLKCVEIKKNSQFLKRVGGPFI